ncbi:Alpha/Beta hydrolase protein [Geopyxis carbonaria]|nr:Alpha/Beta hydrolase protein [Geopyxis carbonaria]
MFLPLALATLLPLALASGPTVTLNKTTTIHGTTNAKTEQFLGIPFAQPPIGALRFEAPRPTSLPHTVNATAYGAACIGFSAFSEGIGETSEDCLTLNVIRPTASAHSAKLPVLVWIYGGGFAAGGSSDPQYDLAPLVTRSAALATPILGVSLNYRLGGYGFLGTNAGLSDQRLALQWVQQNIAAFGGDPARVTIMGESAGAFSVGYHIYSPNSAGLFSAGILESGTGLGAGGIVTKDSDVYKGYWANLTAATGCAAWDVTCLKTVPAATLTPVFTPQAWTPILDDDTLPRLPSAALAAGTWSRVPVLLGGNRDEGTASFWSPRGLNTTADITSWLESRNLSAASIAAVLKLYPNNDTLGAPFGSGTASWHAELGAQYKRAAAIASDLSIHGGRRAVAKAFSAAGQKVWSYRFDQHPWDGKTPLISDGPAGSAGATHYSEIPSVFGTYGKAGLKWAMDESPAGRELSRDIQTAWIGFVNNGKRWDGKVSGGVRWEEYGVAGREMSWKKGGSAMIKDDYRDAPIAFWNREGVWAQLDT